MDRHRRALPRLIGFADAKVPPVFFGELPTGEALGCRLAHSLGSATGRVRKGTLLGEGHLVALAAAGHRHLVVARLEDGDEHEDLAAGRVARALVGGTHPSADAGTDARSRGSASPTVMSPSGAAPADSPAGTTDGARSPPPSALSPLRLSEARTGRVNLFAATDGLFLPDRDILLAANRVDEGITVATLGENVRVAAGRLVATVKIIPFAVPASDVDAVCARLREAHRAARPPLALAPSRRCTAAVLHTTLPTLAESVIEKTSRVTLARLAARGTTSVHEARCEHDVTNLARAIERAVRDAPTVLLIIGASAISDRRDVIPAAVVRAGGTIERFGLPVDPGNLLLLARLGRTTVLGLPGCARSPRDNGLDRVLDRVVCGVPLEASWLESLAVGGLLDEIVERPSPRLARAAVVRTGDDRTGDDRTADDRPHAGRDDEHDGSGGGDRVGALVLAAGSSRRAGGTNKLLYPVAGEPMIRRIVRRIASSAVNDVVVVTGHAADAVGDALAGLARIRLLHHPGHASGMAGSLVRGVAELAEHDAVLVCLGDMPDVSAALVDSLLGARLALAPEERARTVLVPVADGRRGNPVLLGRAFFDLLLALEGDVGARHVIRSHPEAIHEVEVGDAAILRDYDTPEALRALDGRRDAEPT